MVQRANNMGSFEQLYGMSRNAARYNLKDYGATRLY